MGKGARRYWKKYIHAFSTIKSGFQVTCKDKGTQNTFILRQNISVPLSIRPLKFFDTPRLTYPGHDLSWHAVSRVSGTWHSPTSHVSRHVAFRSASRRVSWNITAPKIPQNYSFNAVQGKKHILASQIIEGWVNHDILSHSRLYIIYYQTSFVPLRSWICFCFLFSSFMFKLV